MAQNSGFAAFTRTAEDLIRARAEQKAASLTPPTPSGPDTWIARAGSGSTNSNASYATMANALRDAMVPVNVAIDQHHMAERYGQNHALICAPLFDAAHDRNHRITADVKSELGKLQAFLDQNSLFTQQSASLKSAIEKVDDGFWNWLAEHTRGQENTFGR